MRALDKLTPERLRAVLDFNEETGRFVWKLTRGNTAKSGVVAGSRHNKGYIKISVDGVVYQAHRLAWLYVHGEWPDCLIDHINGNKSDNRIQNLRLATNAENTQNASKARSNNKSSGLLGSSFDKKSQKWRAYITTGGRRTHLGFFDTPDAAHSAYIKAKREHHPFGTL